MGLIDEPTFAIVSGWTVIILQLSFCNTVYSSMLLTKILQRKKLRTIAYRTTFEPTSLCMYHWKDVPGHSCFLHLQGQMLDSKWFNFESQLQGCSRFVDHTAFLCPFTSHFKLGADFPYVKWEKCSVCQYFRLQHIATWAVIISLSVCILAGPTTGLGIRFRNIIIAVFIQYGLHNPMLSSAYYFENISWKRHVHDHRP